jgi:hypothetical protein
MIPAVYNIPNQYAGDTFDGFQVTVTQTSNDVTTPINLDGITLACKFKKDGATVLDLTEGSGITIVDAADGIFKLDAFSVPTETGNYNYDIQFTYSGGSVKTYMRGTMRVIQQVT